MKKSYLKYYSLNLKSQISNLKFLFLVFCSFFFFSSCEQVPLSKIKAMFDEKDADVEVADSVKFIYKEYARAIVTAPKVKRYTKAQSKLEFSNGLLVKFYETLDMISVLKADYGVNDDAKQLIIASGNVHMENAKNEIMESQELTWNIKTKRVWTDKAIRIKTPDNIINGIGFDADEDFSNYTIRKVTGIVSVDDDNGFKE